MFANSVASAGTAATASFATSAQTAGALVNPSFVGTTSNSPLTLSVDNDVALRLIPTFDTPNVIGGWIGNIISNDVEGATIGGGGTVLEISRTLLDPITELYREDIITR